MHGNRDPWPSLTSFLQEKGSYPRTASVSWECVDSTLHLCGHASCCFGFVVVTDALLSSLGG